MNIEDIKKKYVLNNKEAEILKKHINIADELLKKYKEVEIYLGFQSCINTISELLIQNRKLLNENKKLKKTEASLQLEITGLHGEKNPYLVHYLQAENNCLKREKKELEKTANEKLKKVQSEKEALSIELDLRKSAAHKRGNRSFNRTMQRNYGMFVGEYRKNKTAKEIMDAALISKSTYYRFLKLVKEVDRLEAEHKMDKADWKYQKARYIEIEYKHYKNDWDSRYPVGRGKIEQRKERIRYDRKYNKMTYAQKMAENYRIDKENNTLSEMIKEQYRYDES